MFRTKFSTYVLRCDEAETRGGGGTCVKTRSFVRCSDDSKLD